jgi:hypothetical protein
VIAAPQAAAALHVLEQLLLECRRRAREDDRVPEREVIAEERLLRFGYQLQELQAIVHVRHMLADAFGDELVIVAFERQEILIALRLLERVHVLALQVVDREDLEERRGPSRSRTIAMRSESRSRDVRGRGGGGGRRRARSPACL